MTGPYADGPMPEVDREAIEWQEREIAAWDAARAAARAAGANPYADLPPEHRDELEWQDRRYAERQRKRTRGPDDV